MKQLTKEQADLLIPFRKEITKANRILAELERTLAAACEHPKSVKKDCPICTLHKMSTGPIFATSSIAWAIDWHLERTIPIVRGKQ